MFQRILVAVDESNAAGFAIETAGLLADSLGAQIGFLYVIDSRHHAYEESQAPTEELRINARAEALEVLKRRAEQLPAPLRPDHIVREGEPASIIVATAEDYGADLIVIGASDTAEFAEFVLGSTAEDVIRRAQCPVMVVRRRPPCLIAKCETARNSLPGPDERKAFLS